MKSITFRSVLPVCTTVFLFFLIFTSCKKGSGSEKAPTPGTGTSEYYISATVGGKPWLANVKNGTDSVAGGISGDVFLVVGEQTQGTDSTALVLVFPSKPAIKTAKPFDPLQKSVAGYLTATGTYSADPASGGSGSYTVTSLNDTARIIEGEFSGNFVRTEGSGPASMAVSNGKFKTRYNPYASPETPNLKR